jgi:hypothetical protein
MWGGAGDTMGPLFSDYIFVKIDNIDTWIPSPCDSNSMSKTVIARHSVTTCLCADDIYLQEAPLVKLES